MNPMAFITSGSGAAPTSFCDSLEIFFHFVDVGSPKLFIPSTEVLVNGDTTCSTEKTEFFL